MMYMCVCVCVLYVILHMQIHVYVVLSHCITYLFQIDNPVYDPDGDELTFTSVAVDNNRDHVPPVHSVQSEQMLILKEKPYDKKVSCYGFMLVTNNIKHSSMVFHHAFIIGIGTVSHLIIAHRTIPHWILAHQFIEKQDQCSNKSIF